jgi:NAD(P)-dependent dehydrogenase (short-subunit alcohol dehydrogenase family)
MSRAFEGKVVVVTGASAGVGRAIVRRFAKEGADVALIARGIDGLEGAQREVAAEGGRGLVLPLDVSDAASVEDAAERIERELGPIDVWVNDAMVSVFAPISETTPEEFERVTKVTYLGYVYGTLAAMKRMKPRNHGSIVQIGSALAYRSIPLQAAYCGAKHAIHGFTESLRVELMHDGSKLHIAEIELPAVNTPQFGWSRAKLPHEPMPVPPIFQPEMIADAVVTAVRQKRNEIWLAWPSAKAILAEKIAPGVATRYLAKTGFDSQQTDIPIREGRRDNLWEPVPGDHGAHGTFDKQAKRTSLTWLVDKHRGKLLAAAALFLVAGAAPAFLRSR